MASASRVVLGLSCDYHDAAAALLVDGAVAAAVEQERCSRRKHDASLPLEATRECLDTAGVTAADVDEVVFHEHPLGVLSRFLATRQREGPPGAVTFVRSAPRLVGRNLMIAPRVARMLRRLGAPEPPPLKFVAHHRSHAAAAFLPSPYPHAAVLTIDGIGEWATASLSVGSHHRITMLEEQRFPDSLGLVYSLVTAWCGFRPNSDEYKLMGLAPYGEPRYLEALQRLVTVEDDGSVHVDGPAVAWFATRALRRRRLHALLGGAPRRGDAPLTSREADLAASVQALLEDAVLRMARHAHELTGERDLCMAGGVALNCVANGRLLREGPFERVWVQPAAGDAGSALGAALHLWHEALGNPREVDGEHDSMCGAFLGPPTPDADAVSFELDASGVEHRVLPDDDAVAAEVSESLAAGAVVGWYQGRAEFGPRALGHRSILADPRSPTVRARLNARVKGRESFRPFAPAVLAEHASEWFDLGHDSPYMLFVAPVRADRLVEVDPEPEGIEERASVPRSQLPACTHVDGSARVQTVVRDQNPELHSLLSRFHRDTGCPVLLNTSFNVAGEPIVSTVRGAVDTARRADLDLLVIGRVLVERAALGGAARRGSLEAVA